MEFITINLHLGSEIRTVTVDCHDTSSVLEDFLPGEEQHTFYFRNIPIHPEFTFKWFGITDGTDIYVDSQPSCKSMKSNKFKKSKHASNRSLITNSIPHENAKIKDNFMRKVEGTVMCYRKILHRFTHISANDQPRSSIGEPTILPDTPDQPCTESLPRFWDDENDNISYSTISSPVPPPSNM